MGAQRAWVTGVDGWRRGMTWDASDMANAERLGRWKCPECGELSDSIREAAAHIRDEHGGDTDTGR